MKNFLVHGVYLSVIAVLSFLLYDKTKTDDFVFMKSSEALESNFRYFDDSNKSILKNIQKNVDAQPKYQPFFAIAQKIIGVSRSLKSKINSSLNKIKMSDEEIILLKKDIYEPLEIVFSSISNVDEKEELKRKSLSMSLLKDESFWLDFNKVSQKGLTNQLNIIKNLGMNDLTMIINYCLDKTSGYVSTSEGTYFKVAIAPKKAHIIEGEKMEAEIYLSEFKKQQTNAFITINGKPHINKEGVAKFEELSPKIGEHTILASISVKNPWTNDSVTVKGELIYEVLPKCSRDCLQKQ